MWTCWRTWIIMLCRFYSYTIPCKLQLYRAVQIAVIQNHANCVALLNSYYVSAKKARINGGTCMKFKAMGSQKISEEVLKQDYQTAIKQENVKLGEACFYINHTFTAEYAVYGEIERAFRRIEDVRGKLCCGVTNYEIHHLILEIGSREADVMFENKDTAKAALEWILEKNPAVKGLKE